MDSLQAYQLSVSRREQIGFQLRSCARGGEAGRRRAMEWLKDIDLNYLAALIEYAPDKTCHIKNYHPDFDVYYQGCSACGSGKLKVGMDYCPDCGSLVVGEVENNVVL